MSLSTLKRDHVKKNLRDTGYDVVIVGGGITGVDIALDASNRGMKIASVEMQDFVQGTSSRSTKLIHSGLRYLKQLQVGVVAETGKERVTVYENGPYVVIPEWMLLPMRRGGTFGRFSTSIGLAMYDRLAGVKKSERRKMLSEQETLNKEPLVKRDGLKGGGYYVEYRTDDARLTVEVMKRAAKNGAEILNYTRSERLTYDSNKKVNSIETLGMIDGKAYVIKAKKVISASGPWVDEVRSDDYAHNNKQLRLTKGVYVVIDQSKFPLGQAVCFNTEKDGRTIFAIPREGKAYVGTTDTFYDNEKATSLTTQEDRDYLINAINYIFPTINVKDEDIESTWAGTRPLTLEKGKDPSEVSCKDEVWEGESGLLTIAGGELAGYYHMALEIADLLAKRSKQKYGLKFESCATKNPKISGGDVGGSRNFKYFVEQKVDAAKGFGIDEDVARCLASKCGPNADQLFNIAQTAPYHDSRLPLEIYAESVYSIQQEMIYKPTDFLVRRSGRLYFNIQDVLDYKNTVIDVMVDMLNYNETQKEAYTEEIEATIDEACIGNSQPATKA